ncbi:MAG: hypothetical protein M0D55_10885 [Elusimicrobiota bacterium]|nr:MAG: hypothetical protein M0D55_10885 [Elusimicrobiota bacterium]
MSDETLLDFSRAASDALRSALPLAEFLRGRGLPKAAEAVSRGDPLHASLGPAFPRSSSRWSAPARRAASSTPF